MAIKLTTAYGKIRKLTKKFRIIQGGTSSSKTYSIMMMLYFIAAKKPNYIITVMTSTYPKLKDGPIRDLRAIFRSNNANFDDYFNQQDKEVRFSNGAIIEFRNLDKNKLDDGKGPRRDILFINEANRCSYLALEQYIIRTDKFIIFDFNPDAEFWLHEHYINTTRDDFDIIILTYVDNECIRKGDKEEIERRIEESLKPDATESIKNWVRIYVYGQTGTYSDLRIYEFKICDIPEGVKRIPSGIDFGRSPDPVSKIDVYIDGPNLYVDHIFEENNLLPERIAGAERPSIADRLDETGHLKGWLIIADSAGRTEILDLQKHGYNVRGVKKGPGSVSRGIGLLRGYNIHFTPRSTILIKAAESWFWKTDSNGKIIPEPASHEPHGLAALRYVLLAKPLW